MVLVMLLIAGALGLYFFYMSGAKEIEFRTL
jgi:hypothetical protein